MAKKKNNNIENIFESFAIALTKFAGSTPAFIIALVLIILWGTAGPVFDYSAQWHLFIHTGIAITTFLMVFLLQRSHNKDSLAIQLKLNELIASLKGASNRLIDVEYLSEKDLELLKSNYNKLSKLMERDLNIQKSHSIEDAEKKLKQKLPTKKN